MVYLSVNIVLHFLYMLVISYNLSGSRVDNRQPREILNDDEKNQITRIFFEDKVNKLDAILEDSYRKYHFNGHVLVVNHGRIIYDNFIGYADFNTKDTLLKNSVYQLASVSKQFTAMAIMILKEKKLLDYDDLMIDYIPELESEEFRYYNTITIRNLLNHTAGLPNYMYFVEKYKGRDEHPYNDEVVRLISEHMMGLNFVPGSRFSYSNTGYMLLALIVDRVSGMTFADFVEQNIFNPLGMNDSFVYSREKGHRDSKRRLMGFKKYRRFYPIQETCHDGVVGDKGVYSTADDLFKWDRSLYTELLVSKETLEEAFTPATLTNGRKVPYGFGFRIRQTDGKERIIYHNGLWNGFRTSFTRFVDSNSTVLIMDHTDCKAKHIIAKRIEDILLEPHSNFTQVLAENAIENGPEKAIEIYNTMNMMNGDVIINFEELKKAYHFLEENGKEDIAAHIDKLMEALSLQVNS